MPAPRRIIADAFYFLTRRTTQRLFMLRPDAISKQIFAFCLAIAAQKFKVMPIAWVLMSNHYHLVVYDKQGQVPAFAQYLNRLLALVFNARWNRSEAFWASGQCCITRCATEDDMLAKVAYTLGNPVKAKLVDTVAEWPGASSLEYLDGKPRTIERPEYYFAEDSEIIPETAELSAVPPPGSTVKAWAKRVRAEVDAIDARARARRKKDPKFRSIGVKKVLATKPTQRPSKKERKNKLQPHIACRDRDLRIEELIIIKTFRFLHATARSELAAKKAHVVFPEGTYRCPPGRGVVVGKRPPVDSDHLKKRVTRIPHDDIQSTAPFAEAP